MKAPGIRVSQEWLALREPADAAARAVDLVGCIAPKAAAERPWLIHDLAGGTGAMGRWLAPLLPGAQHWVIHDLDPDLLALAAAHPPGPAADGAAVSVEARHRDIAGLEPCDLAGATLITASALLDLLTEREVATLIGVCVAARCPMLLSLSVIGGVELVPPDPLDRIVTAAFNAHQRRVTERGRLLGPDAVALAIEESRKRGAEVLLRPSPWRLGSSQGQLAAEWFTGWLRAGCEQDPELAVHAEAYAQRRLAQAAAGELAVTVAHADLLVSPG
jgi:hypothetical protein